MFIRRVLFNYLILFKILNLIVFLLNIVTSIYNVLLLVIWLYKRTQDMSLSGGESASQTMATARVDAAAGR